MIKIPPYLKPSQTIGIVCPAGSMPLSKIENCIHQLQAWGFQVNCGKTLGKRSSYFSGNDEERCTDLQLMLDDPDIHAILCARGGYGVSRIIDNLNFARFKKYPKWLIGYSDITVLHAHVFRNFHIASLHAPMAGAFNDVNGAAYVATIHKALTGEKMVYTYTSSISNKTGIAEGALVGGNLSLLTHLLATPSTMNLKNKILFLEDIDEYIYHIDRMLVQLKRSNLLAQLAGLIIGSFSGMKDTKLPFGKSVEEIIKEHVAGYSYPVCFDFPVGHTHANVALKHGVLHSLEVKKYAVKLVEIRG